MLVGNREWLVIYVLASHRQRLRVWEASATDRTHLFELCMHFVGESLYSLQGLKGTQDPTKVKSRERIQHFQTLMVRLAPFPSPC